MQEKDEKREGQARIYKLGKIDNSINWKLNIVDFHIREAKKAMVTIDGELADENLSKDMMATILSFQPQYIKMPDEFRPNQGKREKFKRLKLEGQAHIIAYAHSIHSVADILSNGIYLAIDFEKTFAKSRKPHLISIKNIKEDLDDNLWKHPKYKILTDKINILLESDEFIYLDAFVNITKHRDLIKNSLHIYTEQGKDPSFRIANFRYEVKGHNPSSYTVNLMCCKPCEHREKKIDCNL